MAFSFPAGPPLFLSSRTSERPETKPGQLTSPLYVRYNNGDNVVIRPLNNGYQEIEEHFASGLAPLRYKAHRGLYIVWEYEPGRNGKPIPGTGMRIQFPIDPVRLPEPSPGTSWEGDIVKIFDDGSRQISSMDIRFSRASPIQMSGIRYRVVQADLTFDRDTDRHMDVKYLYLPSLSTALYVGSQIANEERTEIQPTDMKKAG